MWGLRAAAFAVAMTSVFGLATPSASAQAWIRDPGEGYVNLSLSRLSGDEIFTQDGERRDIVDTYSQTIIGLYAELGVIDRWLMLTFNGELFRRNELDNQGATQGLGDLQIGAWSGLIEGPIRLTVGIVLGIPTGDDDPSSGIDDESDLTAASLPTGDGEVDITPTVAVGYAFGGQSWPLRHFVTARVGYWLRTRGFVDAITYQVEFGTQVPVTFLDRFWFILRVRGVEAFSEPDQGGFAGLGDGVTYTSPSAEVFGRIWGGLGASVGIDTAVRARSIIAAAPFRFTLSYEF